MKKVSSKPTMVSKYSATFPIVNKTKIGAAAICIDLWQGSLSMQHRIIGIINALPSIEYVFLATYDQWVPHSIERDNKVGVYNTDLKELIKKPCIELIQGTSHPKALREKELYKEGTAKDLREFTDWFQIGKIFMMGGAYGMCLHDRHFGIHSLVEHFAREKRKTEIYLHPSAVSLPTLYDIEGEELNKSLKRIYKNVGPGDKALLYKAMTTEKDVFNKHTYRGRDGSASFPHVNYKILERAEDWAPASIDYQPVFQYIAADNQSKTLI